MCDTSVYLVSISSFHFLSSQCLVTEPHSSKMTSRKRSVLRSLDKPQDELDTDCLPRGIAQLIAFLATALPCFVLFGLLGSVAPLVGSVLILIASVVFWSSPYLCSGVIFGTFSGTAVEMSSSASSGTFGFLLTFGAVFGVARLSVFPLARRYFLDSSASSDIGSKKSSARGKRGAIHQFIFSCCGEVLATFITFLLSITVALVVLFLVGIAVLSISSALLYFVVQHKGEPAGTVWFTPFVFGVPALAALIVFFTSPKKPNEFK